MKENTTPVKKGDLIDPDGLYLIRDKGIKVMKVWFVHNPHLDPPVEDFLEFPDHYEVKVYIRNALNNKELSTTKK